MLDKDSEIVEIGPFSLYTTYIMQNIAESSANDIHMYAFFIKSSIGAAIYKLIADTFTKKGAELAQSYSAFRGGIFFLKDVAYTHHMMNALSSDIVALLMHRINMKKAVIVVKEAANHTTSVAVQPEFIRIPTKVIYEKRFGNNAATSLKMTFSNIQLCTIAHNLTVVLNNTLVTLPNTPLSSDIHTCAGSVEVIANYDQVV